MKIYNVTRKIHENMVVYKNKETKKVKITVDADFDHASVYESRISFNMHTGTHMDFAKHVSKNGQTSKDFDLTTFLDDVKVFDLTHVVDHIALSDVKKLDIHENDIVFFKTKNSFDETFHFDFIYLSIEAATYLKELNIKAVGIDALGIERNQEGHKTHHMLLDHGIYIIEGLDLKDVFAGTYELICLPLYVDDVEGLPLTVLLKETL